MSLARDVTTVGSATLLSRLLAFFRDMGIAAMLGAGPVSDAYFAALQVPNLFRRLLAEGALNAALVPTWLRKREEHEADLRGFAAQVYGSMFLGLGVVTVACIVMAPAVVSLVAPGFEAGERFDLAVLFVRLAAGYIVIAGLVAVSASILNAQRRMLAAAAGIVAFNVVLVGAVLAAILLRSVPRDTGIILSAAVVLAGIMQLICVGSAVLRSPDMPRRFSFSLSPEVRRFYARAIPGLVAAGIPQLKLLAGTIIASSSTAAVSWLYYANRLYELPLGVVSVAIASAMAPHIAAGILAGQRDEIAVAQSRTFEIALGLALPSAAAFAILAPAIAGGLFEHGAFGANDTVAVAAALTAISAGLPGHVLEKAFGAISFAHHDTRTPMYCALAGLGTAVVLSLALFPRYGHVGIAASIAISGWIGALLMAASLLRRGWIVTEKRLRERIAGIVIASVVMTIALAFGQAMLAPAGISTWTGKMAALAALVAAGLAIYLAALHLLGVMKWRMLVDALRERF